MGKNKKDKKRPVAIPENFLERLTEIVGPSVYGEVRHTFVKRPTTFRVNRVKSLNREIVKSNLEKFGFKLRQVPWYRDAFVLLNKSKRELTETDIYKEGKLYIQSLASMVPPLVLDPKPGERVLDLAAAPGSKTSQIAALMEQEGVLVANDVNKVRFFRLKSNMEKLGVSDDKGNWEFTLRLEDGSALCKEYEEPYFDKILVDAICSSESRFIEGDPKTYGYWSPHKIKQVAYRQHKLLMAAWNVLKPGGTLVYSTCTWAQEENESRISKLLERHDDAVVEDIAIEGLRRLPAVTKWKGKDFHPGTAKTLRIFPTEEIEGFFIAKVRKK